MIAAHRAIAEASRWGQSNPTRRLRAPDSDLLDTGNHRVTLLGGAVAMVEDSSVSSHGPAPSGFSSRYQVVLPYAGLFEFRVGSKAPLIDANQTLFAAGGREFADRHPVRNLGHASVIITPSAALLEELCGPAGPGRHPAFETMVQQASPHVRLLTHRLLTLQATNDNPLAGEELTLATLQEALLTQLSRPAPSRLVTRAKEYLHARGYEPLSLDEVASAVGASPVYLTQEFTRSEGMPLYRYQMHVRVNRALRELPSCEDITRLALDLGFSSHSHFSATFKGVFGMTPSQYRALTS